MAKTEVWAPAPRRRQSTLSPADHLQEPLRTMGTYAQPVVRKYGGKLDAEADRFLAFS